MEGDERALLEILSEQLLARSSSFGFAGPLLGASERSSSAILAERLTEERITEKVQVASLLPIPRPSASTNFF